MVVAGLGSPDLGLACLSEASSWHGWLWGPGCLKACIQSQGSCFGAQSISELSLVFWCWWVCQGLARGKVAAGVGGRLSPVTSACRWESWGPRSPKGSASQLVGGARSWGPGVGVHPLVGPGAGASADPQVGRAGSWGLWLQGLGVPELVLAFWWMVPPGPLVSGTVTPPG